MREIERSTACLRMKEKLLKREIIKERKRERELQRKTEIMKAKI